MFESNKFYVINNIVHNASCKRYGNAKEKGTSTISEVTLSDISENTNLKYCKCCKRYVIDLIQLKELQQNFENYLNLIKHYCTKYNYSVELFDNQDICISTNIEKWVIHILSIDEDIAQMKLYHKNNLQFGLKHSKCGSSSYPEYHLQFRKSLTPSEAVLYMHNHEKNKWGAKAEISENVTVLNNSLL